MHFSNTRKHRIPRPSPDGNPPNGSHENSLRRFGYRLFLLPPVPGTSGKAAQKEADSKTGPCVCDMLAGNDSVKQ